MSYLCHCALNRYTVHITIELNIISQLNTELAINHHQGVLKRLCIYLSVQFTLWDIGFERAKN